MAAIEPNLPPALFGAVDEDPNFGYTAGKSTQGKWQKFVSYIWDSDYYEKSDAERHLVFKLDCFMLASMTLGWWLKNVDQSNLANAYVSGMKEDLKINANQYTYMGTIYNIVVCVGCIVANFIAIKVRPSLFLALSEIGWGIFTFAQAGAQNYQAMYGFRFAIAFFESFYYPVAFFILGSWYTKPELAKRIGLWFVAGPAGSAFSGYMQAGIYKNMDGLAGLAGWRWLYVMCGIMTVPCGILLFFLVPDFPENSKVWYLSEEEVQLARIRSSRNGRCDRLGISDGLSGTHAVKKKIDVSVIVGALKTPMYWSLVLFYAIYGFAVQNGAQFGVYLKAHKYSVSQRNVLPSGMYLIEIPCILFYCFLSDRFSRRSRALVLLGPLIWGIFPTAVLAFWGHSNTLRVFAFMINGSIYITPVFYAWVAEICGHRTELRAFITGSTSCLFYCINAWLPAIIFLQTDGPRFKKGFTTTFAFVITSIFFVLVIWFLHEREKKKAAMEPLEQEAHEKSADEESKA